LEPKERCVLQHSQKREEAKKSRSGGYTKKDKKRKIVCHARQEELRPRTWAKGRRNGKKTKRENLCHRQDGKSQDANEKKKDAHSGSRKRHNWWGPR